MSNTAHTANPPHAGRRFTRFVRTSLKPVIFKLSRKLSVTYWPGRRRSISGMLIALLTQFVPGFAPGLVHAAPVGAQVMAGSASVSQASKLTTNITQTTQNAVINWQSFSIGAKESVNIVQPGASSVLLNRVIGGDPSRIFGSLSANGQVFLVNNAGVYFAPGASVNVGGLVASSMNITDSNFLAGKYQFDAGVNAAAVTNEGQLAGRYVVLSAPQVTNAGSIEAPAGSIALVAGGRVNLVVGGSDLVSLSVDAATVNAAVVNSGNLRADGGKVFLTARSSNAVLDTVINTSGIVRATSLVNRNGAIVIDGGTAGVVQVGGALVVAGVDAGSTGGTVKVLGDKVSVLAGATIDVSGDAGGGTALIGGNFHGAGPEANASQVNLAKGAVIHADAITSGNGGQVAVWADGNTRFAGSISAKGGALGGDGGFVETSGKGTLAFSGSVDTLAANGKTGTLLLDPTNITINNEAQSVGMTDSGGLFTDPIDAESTLSASTLVTALAQNSVIVNTYSRQPTQGNITVQAPINWTSNSNTLTLIANKNIYVNNRVANSGSAAIVMIAGDGFGAGEAAGGDIILSSGAISIGAGGKAILYTGSVMGSSGLTALAVAGSGRFRYDSTPTTTNYSMPLVNGINVIYREQPILTFAPVHASITYGDNSSGLSTNVTGFINGDTSAQAIRTPASMVIAGATSTSHNLVAGSHLMTASGAAENLGYAINYESNTVDVLQKAITVTGIAAMDKIYDATRGATLVTSGAALNNGAATQGDIVSFSAIGATGSFVSKDVGVAKAVTVNGLTLSGADAGNYTVSASAQASITPLAITTTGISAGNKVYDTTSNAAINTSGATLGNQIYSGDIVSLNASGASGAYLNKAAGVDKSVAISGLKLTGAEAFDYTIIDASNIKSTITPAMIGSVTGIAGNNKTYDGNTIGTSNANAAAFNGLMAGDNLAAASASVVFGDKNVGNAKAVSITNIVLGGADKDNYTLVNNTASSTAAITRLDSVNWVGGNTGNWSQASNWAGNAIPDLANVKQVNIPVGTSVTFDANVGTTGAVQLDAISSLGGLAISSGTLTVAGNLATSRYTQTGGAVAAGSLSASNYFHQTDGSLAVSGNVNINQASGAVVLGDASMAALTVTSNGDILQSAASGLTVSGATTLTAVARNINLTNVSNDFGGNVTVTGGATSLTTEHGLSLNGSVTGNLAASAGGAVTQLTSLSVGGSTNIHADGHSVTLDNPGNALTGAVTLASGTTTLRSTLGLTLDGSVAGDLTTNSAGLMLGATSVIGSVSATSTGAVSQSAAVNVTGNSIISAPLQAVMLANPGNHFGAVLTMSGAATQVVDGNTLTAHLNTTGATSVSTGANDLIIDGSVAGNLNTHSAALSLGATSVMGDMTAAASGAVSQSGNVSVTGASTIAAAGQSVTLANPLNTFAGLLSVAGAATRIKNTGALTAHLTTTDTTGLTSTAGLLVDGSVMGTLSTDSVALSFGPMAVNGNLNASARGAIGQSSTLTVAGTSTMTAPLQSVTLSNTGNNFGGALSLVSAADTSISSGSGLTLNGSVTGNLTTSSGALTLGTTTVGGNWTANAAGAVSQAGSVNVSGASNIAAAGQSVTLANPANVFGGAVTTTSAATQIVDVSGLTAHLNTTGPTSLVSACCINVDGSVVGDLSTQSAALNFGATTVTGNLMTSATGAVTQRGALTVAGTSKIAAAGQTVTLNNPGNNLSGALTIAGAATQIVDTAPLTAHLTTTGPTSVTSAQGLTLDGSVAGNLTAAAGGAVSQSGALLVTGSTGISATGNSVMLTDAGNNFGGALNITSASAQIIDMNALTIGGSVSGDLTLHAAALTFAPTTLGGNLAATAGGAVGQTGALQVAGSTGINAVGQSVMLAIAGNDFGGALSITGAAIQVVDKNALIAHLATTGAASLTAVNGLTVDGSVGGDLTATAGGAVSQSGALLVMGNTGISAAGQAVTLNNAGNDFGGAVTITGAATQIVDKNALMAHLATTGATSLTAVNGLTVDGTTGGDLSTNSAALTFGATHVTGNLSAAATGAVSQTDALVVLSVLGSTGIAASGQTVTLTNASNVFGGPLTVTSAAAKIVDLAALTAHVTTTGATSIRSGDVLLLDGSVAGDLSTSSKSLTLGATTVAGKFNATATGAVNQTGALNVGGSTGITATAQAVTLNNPGNNFGGALAINSAATTIMAANALTAHLGTTGPTSLTSANGMNVDGSVVGDLSTQSAAVNFGATAVTGNLITSASGAVTQSGILAVTGTSNIAAAGQSVTLNNPGNNLGGALTVAGAATQIVNANALTAHLSTTGATGLTAANGLTVDGSASGDLSTHSAALSFGPTTIGGNLTAAAGGAVGQSGALLVAGSTGIAAAGQAITLGNAANDFGGALTIASAATQIADKNALTVHLTTTGTSSITAANGLTLDGSVSADLSTYSAALAFGTTLVTGNLTAAASGAVNQTGALTVLGSAGILASGQTVTLTNATNVFGGPLSVTSAAAQIVDIGALTAHLSTTGATSIRSGATLLLDGSVTGDLSTLSNALALGATTISGQFNATATGAVSQTGVLNVGGSTGIAAAGQAVTLSNPGNNFGGALSVAGAATRIVDTAALTAHLITTGATSLTAINGLTVDGSVAGNLNTNSAALNFGATIVSGNLSAAATGAVSQSGALTVAGSSGIAASGQAVILTNAGNDFGGALTLAGAAVQIADTNALIAHVTTTGPTSLTAANGLTLDGSAGGDVTTTSAALSFGTTAIAGNLNATAVGAISQTGALTVAGTTGIVAAVQAVTLTNPGNDFGGAVTITGAAVQLADQHALTAHVATTGATSLTAVNGLTLDGSVAGDLSTHSAALSFGPTAIGGNLNATAAGAISQTAPLTVAGTTGIAAAGQTVTLSDVGNDFGGALTVAAAAIQIADQKALIAHLSTTGPSRLTAVKGLTVDGSIAGDLVTQSAELIVGPTTVAGNLTAAATGAVSQSGALLVAGSTGIAAAGQAVVLTNAGNDFGGDLTVASAATQIADRNALTAHVATTGTTSITAVNGLMLDGNIKGDLSTHSAALSFGTTRVGGNLTAAAVGALGQSGALTVDGSTGIAAAGQNVMLNNAGNAFGGALTLTSAAAQITDTNALTIGGNVAGDLTIHSAALTFGKTALTGNLAVTASGAVGQTDALTVAGSTGIAAASQGVTLGRVDNNLVGTVSVSGGAVTLADNNVLTLGKITATQANLSAQTTLQMASGGMVDAKNIMLALGLAGTPLGSLVNPINVQALANVTFGATTPAVTAYFTSVPSMSFKFNNPLAAVAYYSGAPLIYLNNVVYNNQLVFSANGTLYGSISRVLQAIQKKADGYAEAIDRGLQSNLAEYAAYPHTGSLKLQAPICAGVLRVKADSKDAVQARACTALIMVR